MIAYVTGRGTVELYDDGGNLLEIAGPFDDSDDAEFAAERILRLAGE